MEGTEITAIREMSDDEYEMLYWRPDNAGRARVMDLSDGSTLIPSKDPEGNGAGYFAGLPKDPEDVEGAIIERLVPDKSTPGINAHRPTPPKIKLSNGVGVTPLADPEGNGPGVLYQVKDGDVYQIQVSEK